MAEQRIKDRFAHLAAQGRTALITYVMAGDPDVETSLEVMRSIRDAGADLIELGIPFTDPMADGPVIQAAGLRSLAAGMRLSGVLELVERFRADDTQTPIILMGYANPVFHYGYERFAQDAARVGVDAMICVDLPPEEDKDLRTALEAQSMAMIRLATPTSDAARMQKIQDGASGFVYYVSVAGVTGSGSGSLANIRRGVERARSGGLPVAVGFGIRTPERAAELARFCDAIVVGTGLIECMHEAGKSDLAGLKTAVGTYIASLAEVL